MQFVKGFLAFSGLFFVFLFNCGADILFQEKKQKLFQKSIDNPSTLWYNNKRS